MDESKLLGWLNEILSGVGQKRTWLETTPPSVIGKLRRGADDLLQKRREDAELIEAAEAELTRLTQDAYTDPRPIHVEAEIAELRVLKESGGLSDEGAKRLTKLQAPTGAAKRIAELETHLPNVRQHRRDLDRLLENVRKAISAREAAMSNLDVDPATATLVKDARKKAAAADLAGESYADALRALYHTEQKLRAHLGTPAAERQLGITAFRERIHHAHARLFEVDPAAPGGPGRTGQYGASVLLTLPEMTAGSIDRGRLDAKSDQLYTQLARAAPVMRATEAKPMPATVAADGVLEVTETVEG